jgi:hypothetical protein
MFLLRIVLIGMFCIILNACGEEAVEQAVTPPVDHAPQQSADASGAAPQKKSAGGVTVKILPENPTSVGCLRAVIQGALGRSSVVWSANGSVVASGTGTQLCSDHYKRDDLVTVTVGTVDVGAAASVQIGNSLPRVVDISSTPDHIFAGSDITVVPVAEDADGDDVSFSYQWLVNGESNPLLTEATLPGSSFTKGDTVQVLIVPYDFFVDGPTYKSYTQLIPNAPPQITSQPPQGISSLVYSYQVVASDPDDTAFSYRLDEAPEGMTIDEKNGLVTWDLFEVNPASYTIAIVVADPEGAEAAQEYKLTLGAPE